MQSINGFTRACLYMCLFSFRRLMRIFYVNAISPHIVFIEIFFYFKSIEIIERVSNTKFYDKLETVHKNRRVSMRKAIHVD